MKHFLASAFLSLSLFLPLCLLAEASLAPTEIEFYYSDQCSHCQQARPFLEQLVRENPGLKIKALEVWNNQDNLMLLMMKASQHGYTPDALPNIYVGDRYWVGFDQRIGRQIRDELGLRTESPAPASSSSATTWDVPLFGPVDLGTQSLLFSTVLIGLVDGINPCSLWLLSMLLTLALHGRSRGRVVIIGLVFLVVTAAVYGLFITGLFALTNLVSWAGTLTAVVVSITAVFGLLNLKDFFWFGKGPSLSIPSRSKPGILQRMRALVSEQRSFGWLVAGTAVLAAGVSVLELGCTAGFPLLWTQLLSAQHADTLTYGGLLAVYLLMYQLLPLALFLVVVFTLGAVRLQERQGRLLKLGSGVLLLTLSGVMLWQPIWMRDLSSAALVFAAALALGLVLWLAERQLRRYSNRSRRTR